MFTQRLVDGGDDLVNLARGPENGPPLLFLHGVGRCWQDYAAMIPAFESRWQVHGLDFRGHGLSRPTSGRYRVRDYVRDVVAVVKHAIQRPTILYGHSLGALSAAAAAAELGDLARGVVLEDPPLRILGRGIRNTPFFELFTIMREASRFGGSVAELAKWLSDQTLTVAGSDQRARLGDTRDASALRFGAACLKRVDAELWNPLLEGDWMEGYDPGALLPRIACPVLLLYGKLSEGGMLSESEAAEAASLIPDCARVFVPRAGHLIHGMQSEVTLRLVSGFLESLLLTDGLA